jgi:HPt (histidine-containing phosphotransfer) domain-containing protein
MLAGNKGPSVSRGEAAMAEAAIKPAGAASPAQTIDRAHLARMTFGDRALERELLGLFDRQATILLARMCGAPPEALATLAHTLKGSATGVGAWHVAHAADTAERAAGPAGSAIERSLAIADLAVVIEDARDDIAGLLRD